MTDKVQKIRKEVERLMDELVQEKEKGFGSDIDDACILELQNVLTYIDSLQEEPVSINFEHELYKAFGQVKDFTLGMRIAKWFYDMGKNSQEPVSKKLDEAAWLYYDRNKPPMPPELDLHKELIDFFKAGARWKKQNDSNLSEVLVRDNLDKMAEEYSSCTYLEEVLGEGDREVLKARLKNTFKAGAKWGKNQAMAEIQAQSMALAHGCPKEPVSNDLGEYINELSKQFPEVSFAKLSRIAVRVAKWKEKHLWKPADGDDLPEYEREVVVFTQNFPDDAGIMSVSIAHRPNPDGWDGKSLATGKIEHYIPKTYCKGGWSIPDVVWWLDYDFPKEIEL